MNYVAYEFTVAGEEYRACHTSKDDVFLSTGLDNSFTIPVGSVCGRQGNWVAFVDGGWHEGFTVLRDAVRYLVMEYIIKEKNKEIRSHVDRLAYNTGELQAAVRQFILNTSHLV